MYRCRECGVLFDAPAVYKEYHGDYSRPAEKLRMCPYCGGDFAPVEETEVGYRGIGENSGTFIPAEAALSYAKERCGIKDIDSSAPDAQEFCEMLVEWYFSGEWVKQDGTGI